MKFNTKSEIFKSLIFGFGWLISLFIIYEIYSLYEIQTISRLTRTIYNHPLVVSNASLQANVSITKMHRNMKDVVLFDSKERVQKSINAVDAEEQVVYTNLDIVKETILGKEGQKLEAETRKLFDDWRDIRTEVINLVREGKTEEAAEITIGKGAQHVVALESKMLALTNYARTKATSFMGESQQKSSTLKLISVLLFLLAICSFFFIALLTLRNVAKAETKLQESNQLLTSAIDYAPIGMVLVHPKGRFHRVNEAFCKITGYSEQELLNMTFQDVTHPEDYDIGRDVIERLMKGTTNQAVIEKRYQKKDGSTAHIYLSTTLLRDQENKPLYFFTQVIDVSERREMERLLKESESKFRNIAESVPGLVLKYKLNPDGTDELLYISKGVEELFEISREDALKNVELLWSCVHKDDLEEYKDSIETSRRELSLWEIEHRILLPSGQLKWIKARGVPTLYPDGSCVWDTLQIDITDRKLADNELKEKSDFLDKVIDSAALSTWISDENGTAIRANPACLELFGATEDEVIGKYNIFQDNLVEENGFMPEIHKVFREGIPANIVIDYDLSDVGHVDVKNAEHKTINSIFTPIKNAQGKITNVIVQTIDLSDIKRMENELIRSHRMESIGTLAGGVAHEFNNMLAIIIGNNDIVMENSPAKSLIRECTEEIRTATLRARDVVRQLLTFSRQDKATQQVIDLNADIQESLKLVRSSTPANIEIECNFPTEVIPVRANSTQINQLVINICNNAVDAVSDQGGRLAVELSKHRLDEANDKHLAGLNCEQYAMLTIRDNGTGMDGHTLERIFEPYYTTKDVGEGSGIGMAVVHGIVERHGGLIEATSMLGQGATITTYLPIHDGDVENVVEEESSLPKGKERILLVDDEVSIANMGKRLLGSLGYRIESVTSPLEVLEKVRKEPDTFDLIISDMAMPVMTGDQLIKELLEIRPDLPTIICTGYSARISKEDALEFGVRELIMKPFNKKELATVVRRVLDESED